MSEKSGNYLAQYGHNITEEEHDEGMERLIEKEKAEGIAIESVIETSLSIVFLTAELISLIGVDRTKEELLKLIKKYEGESENERWFKSIKEFK